jgi:hypothetical protein
MDGRVQSFLSKWGGVIRRQAAAASEAVDTDAPKAGK